MKNFNFILVTFVTALSIIGIMAVGSAQKSMQGKQIFGVILGLLVMLLFSVIDYKWILRFYWILYAVNLILLLLVHFLEQRQTTQSGGLILDLSGFSLLIQQRF